MLFSNTSLPTAVPPPPPRFARCVGRREAAGGDSRGMQSAAMLIVQEDGGVWLNNDVVLRLQVDDSENPILELRRLVDIANQRFGPRRQ